MNWSCYKIFDPPSLEWGSPDKGRRQDNETLLLIDTILGVWV